MYRTTWAIVFERDEAKRRASLAEHRLDFRDAAALFDGRPRLDAPAAHRDEARHLTIAASGDVPVALVWTWRGDRRRAISPRRARDGEREAYRQLFRGGTESDG